LGSRKGVSGGRIVRGEGVARRAGFVVEELLLLELELEVGERGRVVVG
jgi:hypothetical protein